jgi:hypothetical protein
MRACPGKWGRMVALLMWQFCLFGHLYNFKAMVYVTWSLLLVSDEWNGFQEGGYVTAYTLFVLFYWCVFCCVHGQSVGSTKSSKYIQLVELSGFYFSFNVFQPTRLITGLMWVIIEWVVIISYRNFGTSYIPSTVLKWCYPVSCVHTS